MNNRGKLINIAFAVSGSFVLGDVLAFTGGANPEMVFPVIVAKLSGGILAIALTLFLLKRGKIKVD
ncbi:ethanolamine utilization protein EutH [Ohessyouella blattaphilus]|uniref:Ethanolamine utilization protein EutH n=1 Tax=Ohessyouella blattaphilus TaxID=2949333 RepID=A0ABT1EG22_9FIRM|nr:ethanolamine utilization protein EutH [Ohessyouella blattaphilus]MCP1109657.1 ethanolamine utilization protein EutH [Ohessyouella blattaphilus]MCR8563051.1 ethanolamine utilization protein EutH [Ohessyouella blattaphilus]